MSKFLNIFAPALGGTATLLGAAYIAADQFVVDVPAPLRGQAIPAAEAQTTPEPVAEEAAQATDAAPAEVAAEPTESQPEAPAEAAPVVLAKFGLGRPATDDEIAAWDVKVMPDGRGLPEGSGSVEDGEALFSENCAVCHGEFAEGSGNWPKLAGGDGTLADEDPLKTVGSYWPYLSTTFDYIHRSMPFGAAQTLSADDTYAITAYILYSNFMVDEDFVLTRENFLEVEMPNAEGFIVDDRAETEYPQWRAEPCMENCKDIVEITMRATVLDVTPEEEGAAEEVAQVTEAAAPADEAQAEEATVETVAAEEPATQEAAPEEPAAEDTMAAADPELIAAGEKVFKKCKACHQVGAGAENKTGPQLNGIMGRTAGTVEGFKYSKAMSEAGEGGLVWNTETLAGFLAKPKAYLKGTKMSFNGLRKEDDIAAVEAYLGSFAE
ncbi:c-type cytochrome [Vannielia litorea]|uniref:c-type cytochrome n=1 Tax=Vannielia litorea TaxID=1217970 RepID=UPI001C9504CD|nr:c-type cytochrome [Vannielia litorea]MBY6048540.1 c-type cytochrome [Vannielia litorea]MBY6075954.1 c-type cytochrome [Vannielia litorea]